MFTDCIVFVAETIDDIPSWLAGLNLSSGFIYGNLEKNGLIPLSEFSPVLLHRAGSAANQEKSTFFISVRQSADLIQIFDFIKDTAAFVYFLIKLSPEKRDKWMAFHSERINSLSLMHVVTVPEIQIANQNLYLCIQVAKSGYTRVDRKKSTDLLENALMCGTLGCFPASSFINNDLLFRTGLSSRFGS